MMYKQFQTGRDEFREGTWRHLLFRNHFSEGDKEVFNSKDTGLADYLTAHAESMASSMHKQIQSAQPESLDAVFREWLESQLAHLRGGFGYKNDWAVSLVDWVRTQDGGADMILDLVMRFREVFINQCRESKILEDAEIDTLSLGIMDRQCRLMAAYWTQVDRETRAAGRRRLRAIAEAVKSPFITLTPEGAIDIANHHFSRLSGLPPEEISGRDLAGLCDETAAIEVRRCLRQRRATANRVFNGHLITSNDRKIPLEFVVQPIFDEQGLRDGVSILMEDPSISEDKDSDYLRIVAENIVRVLPMAVQVFNRDRRILYRNPQCIEIFGNEGLDDKPLCCQLLVSQKNEKACVCEQVFESGEIYMGDIQGYLNHERHSFRVLIAPILDLDGGIARVVCAMNDISREKRLENRLFEQQRTSLASQVATSVAHQLRNPLAVVIGFTEMLSKGLPPDQVPAAVDKMLRNGLRCKEIVEDLLEFGQGYPGERVTTELCKLLRESVEPFIPPSKNRLIDWQLPKTPVWIECVPGQLAQVFLSLIDNALHFALSRVEFQVREEGPWIEIRVTDDGPGVPEEIRSRIFQPFFTTRREEGGVGLGLSLSQSVVNEYGGTLQLAALEANPAINAPGAAFVVQLPLVKDSQLAIAPAEALPETASTGLKLLVVDDEEDLLEMLEMILDMRGYGADTTGSAIEAMELLKQNRYDAMVLDIQLPGDMKGPQLFEYLQASYPELAQHTMFITADTMNFETRRFLDRVKRPSMEKPFLVHDFVTAIGRLVEKA